MRDGMQFRKGRGFLRVLFLSSVLLLLLAGCASQGRGGETRPDEGGERHEALPGRETDLDVLLERDDFDLPLALLLFRNRYAPEFFGEQAEPVHIDAWLSDFESLTDELRSELRRCRSARQRQQTLADFLHVRLGLRFDPQDEQGLRPENLFFDLVLQRKRGYCVTLSLAWIVFGQAAGMDITGLRAPGHFLVRFRDADEHYETLAETTNFGSPVDETELWAEHRFSAQSVEQGVFLTSLSDREIFSTLYNNLAGLTHYRGDDALAMQRYSRALELAPNNVEALYNRALLQERADEAQPALRDLNEALRLDPNFTLALLARAGLYWNAGEQELSRKDLALALRQRPDWPEPHLLDGTLLAQEGRYEEAREAFQRALRADPENPDALEALARLETLQPAENDG